jgi:hypothetical protein
MNKLVVKLLFHIYQYIILFSLLVKFIYKIKNLLIYNIFNHLIQCFNLNHYYMKLKILFMNLNLIQNKLHFKL